MRALSISLLHVVEIDKAGWQPQPGEVELYLNSYESICQTDSESQDFEMSFVSGQSSFRCVWLIGIF